MYRFTSESIWFDRWMSNKLGLEFYSKYGTYLENTNSNSPNPVVSFENDGLYQVSLTTENSNSISSIEKNNFYNVISADHLRKK